MKLKKAIWELLPADLKKSFRPVVTGDQKEEDAEEYDNGEEDANGLKSALSKEREELKRIKEEQKALAEGKTAAELEAAKKKGDLDALEKSWQKKLDTALSEEKGKATKLSESLTRMLVTEKAKALAAEISTVPDLLADVIAKRLGVDLDGDIPKTRILDAEGKPSALDFDGLKKEILAEKRYAAILKGVDSSGGGAGTGRPGTGGFDLKNYKKSDGSVDWGKVNAATQKDASVLKTVQDALLAEQRGGTGAPVEAPAATV